MIKIDWKYHINTLMSWEKQGGGLNEVRICRGKGPEVPGMD